MLANDVRRSWFCFNNEADARAVAKAGTHAVIVIRDYQYSYSHSDVGNTVKVVNMEQQ